MLLGSNHQLKIITPPQTSSERERHLYSLIICSKYPKTILGVYLTTLEKRENWISHEKLALEKAHRLVLQSQENLLYFK